MNVLVIAPHPDDEVLGLGGTLHRLAARGHDIVVAVVTKGWSPLFPPDQVKQVRRRRWPPTRISACGPSNSSIFR